MINGIRGEELPAIRLLIANVPPSSEEWLARELQSREDIQVVGRVQGYVEMLLAAQAGVDVLLLSEEDLTHTPGICSHLLSEFPLLKILLISPQRDKAVLYWMGRRQMELQFAVAGALVTTLRHLDALTSD